MSAEYLAAAVQLNSGEDKRACLRRATGLVEQAAEKGAQLVVLPELFNGLGRFSRLVSAAESIPGPTSDAMGQLAARLKITLLAGTIAEQSEAVGRAYNTSLLFGPDGQLIARYRKIHLFDVHLPGRVTVDESRWIQAGDAVTTAATPLGNFGLSICYDLRFPELYRRLADQQGEIFFVPSAFTRVTGRAHWEVLIRARAIENQAYVIGANQCGRHPPDLETYGNSLIVDPWGEILARAADDEAVILAKIDLQRLRQVRQQLPALNQRRLN
ncbi:MAG: carbon-nitrogen hydrolase family protein [Planctomycetales bacterium]|nr:carbon-nitrogen hydrolase family protein [Planctomycetales bacterium]NIM08062.1 carbon-nitrogen hydrolase family protein [Planctomycetales bacterium]NIN07553.1 carbon-nitrogen hydrolase family protein [Planctomycetales bacterium]NIN76660.1 carbon-nitrogen hydrolase family protein [Planctomycetales bacterium]NIO33848.1 carbon-nitrogen hydrolase family protein [Planctomycetales bacterium]